MNDRELLEAAARAAGMQWDYGASSDIGLLLVTSGESWARQWKVWNPLTDDGDALRLAVNLGLAPSVFVAGASDGCTMVSSTTLPHGELFVEEMHEQDPYAATRRAIVRAAATIGGTK